MMLTTRRLLLVLGTVLLLSMQTVCSMAEEESKPATEEAVQTKSADASDESTNGAEAPTCDAPTCEGENAETKEAEETKDEKVDPEQLLQKVPATDPEDRPKIPPPVINPDPIMHPKYGELPGVKIPDFTHGGVLVFFHFYKTGGSSITEMMVETKADFEEDMEEEDEESIVFINNREDMTGEDIENSVTMAKNRNISVFYNFHVEFPETMYPTLLECQEVLDAWRQHAKANGVPFFVGTVLREPLGHALSFFNFFHVAVDEEEWSPFTGDLDATEENFLKTYVPNRLCHLMYDDAHGILEAPDFALREGLLDNIHHFMDEEELNRRNEPSFCDVEKMKTILFTSGTFDYVGVTEKISTHVLPMFMQIVFGDFRLAQDAEPRKEAQDVVGEDWVPLKKAVLSEETKEKVRTESSKDQELYEEARERFAHWPQYL